MKFSVDKSVLMNAINTVMKAVPPKSPMTSLEGILFETGNQTLKLTGYDLKKAIYTVIDADIQEEGRCCFNARFFSEMVRRLGDGFINISCDENNATKVKCGKSEYNFVSLDTNEYPEIPLFDKNNRVEIPQGILKNMIQKTIFAVSKEEARPIYTGSLFEVEGNILNVVAIDGYRLARRTEKIENSYLEDCTFIVPGSALSDIEKICDDSDDNTQIDIGEKHISFKIGKTVVISRRLEGEFLNHKKSIPENFRYKVQVDRSEFLNSLERVSLMLSEKNENPIRLTFNDGYINCLCATPVGKAEDICTCVGDCEELEIGFNDRYIRETLKASEDEQINICLNTSSSPCVIEGVENKEKYTYMILPVRLRS